MRAMNFGGRTHVTGRDDHYDRALLRAHLSGDQRAFATLISRHRSTLLATARRHSDFGADPSDGLQEGIIRALAAAPRFRGQSSVLTWLTHIIKHACVDYHRASFGRVPVCSDGESYQRALATTAARGEDIALRLTMTQALGKLPGEQRDALLYLDVFGYSLREAARCMGQPSGTLKSRRHRARSFLRRQLTPALAA